MGAPGFGGRGHPSPVTHSEQLPVCGLLCCTPLYYGQKSSYLINIMMTLLEQDIAPRKEYCSSFADFFIIVQCVGLRLSSL